MKDFESRVINSILRLPKHEIHTFLNSQLRVELFSSRQSEFKFLRKHMAKHNVRPSKELFKRNFPNFVFCKVRDPLESLTEELLKRKQRNLLVDLVNKLGDESSLQEDLPECIAEVAKASIDVNKFNINNSDHEYVQGAKERRLVYEDRKVNLAAATFSTGCDVMDSYLAGGFKAPQLCVIAGDPAMGKSWLMVNMAAKNRAMGKKGLIISPEMSHIEVEFRLDALQYELPHGELIAGKLTKKQEARWRARMNAQTTPLHICDVTDDTQFSPTKLLGKIEMYRPDYVIVDSAYYMVSDTADPKRSSFQDNMDLVKQLKGLCKQKNIPIICIVQMNRDSEKNKMTGESALRGIYGGDHWAQGCDVLLRLTGARSEAFRKFIKLKDREGAAFQEDMLKFEFSPCPSIYSVTNYTAADDDLDVGDEVLEIEV